MVARTSAGFLGLVLLAAIAVVGLGRLLEGRRSPGRQRVRGAVLADLVAVLLPLQLAIFITPRLGGALLAVSTDHVGSSGLSPQPATRFLTRSDVEV